MHFTTVLILDRSTSLSRWRRLRVEDHACSGIRSTGILLEGTANVGLQDHLIDVLIHELLNVDLLRDLLGHFNSLFLDLSTCASTSLALPRLGRPSRQSQLCFTQHGHTGSTATTPEQPGNTSLCHVQMLLRYQDEKVLVWIVFLSCSCRVPVVLGGFVSRLGYPHGLTL